MSRIGTNQMCNKKHHFRCPVLVCQCGICMKCFKDMYDGEEVHMINPPVIDDLENNSSCSECSTARKDSDASDFTSEDLNVDELVQTSVDSGGNLDVIDSLVASIGNDSLDDCVLLGEDDQMPLDEVVSEDFPSTLSGNTDFIVEEDVPKGMSVSGYVIMNKCGSLLNMKDREIISYRYQTHFLQRIASVISDRTIPLLYPERMMWESFVWKMVPTCGSIYGFIPSGLLVQSVRNRFASIKNHVTCRFFNKHKSTIYSISV